MARRTTRQRQPMKPDRRESLMGGDGMITTMTKYRRLTNALHVVVYHTSNQKTMAEGNGRWTNDLWVSFSLLAERYYNK
jgi:hypothetical protein